MSIATIETALRDLQDLPTPVRAWRVETGPDATEDEAVWVWVTLAHHDIDLDTRASVRQRVREAVSRVAGESPWVYVRFRGPDESEDE